MLVARLPVSLLVAAFVTAAGCNSEDDNSVPYYVMVVPTNDGGVRISLANFRPDLVSADSLPTGQQRLVISDASGLLAEVTAWREDLPDGHIRVIVSTNTSEAVCVMPDGFADLRQTVDGALSHRIGEQLTLGKHKIVLEGRPNPDQDAP